MPSGWQATARECQRCSRSWSRHVTNWRYRPSSRDVRAMTVGAVWRTLWNLASIARQFGDNRNRTRETQVYDNRMPGFPFCYDEKVSDELTSNQQPDKRDPRSLFRTNGLEPELTRINLLHEQCLDLVRPLFTSLEVCYARFTNAMLNHILHNMCRVSLKPSTLCISSLDNFLASNWTYHKNDASYSTSQLNMHTVK